MLSALTRLTGLGKQLTASILRGAHAAIGRIKRTVRGAWRHHHLRVTTNAAYAAAAAAVLSGLLGFTGYRDVLAAVLTAVFGVHVHRSTGTSTVMTALHDEWEEYE